MTQSHILWLSIACLVLALALMWKRGFSAACSCNVESESADVAAARAELHLLTADYERLNAQMERAQRNVADLASKVAATSHQRAQPAAPTKPQSKKAARRKP